MVGEEPQRSHTGRPGPHPPMYSCLEKTPGTSAQPRQRAAPTPASWRGQPGTSSCWQRRGVAKRHVHVDWLRRKTHELVSACSSRPGQCRTLSSRARRCFPAVCSTSMLAAGMDGGPAAPGLPAAAGRLGPFPGKANFPRSPGSGCAL